MNQNNTVERLIRILDVALTLYGLFVAYQLLRAILGGSWESSDLIGALVVAHSTALTSIALILGKMHSDARYTRQEMERLNQNVKELSADFKEHAKANS